jgi:15-cis-phytoene synthase
METSVSEQITRKSASNLALAFVMLPREKRLAMNALYAYCREVDDVADEESIPLAQRRDELAKWREQTKEACRGGSPSLPVIRELQPAIEQYQLPFSLFDDLLKGVETDLDTTRYESYAQLEEYCYRVASVVGLLSIEIFGYHNERCKEYAIHLGKALQFTNILRDVGNDAERGRIYLPAEAMRECGVRDFEILEATYSRGFNDLATVFAAKARDFYQAAQECLPTEDRKSMIAAELMGTIYWRLLKKLEAGRFQVLGPVPTRLGKPQKILLVFNTWLRNLTGVAAPRYGA